VLDGAVHDTTDRRLA